MTETHVLGIRHHGPGSAARSCAALAELRPDIVLIEGPPEADAMVRLAADEAWCRRSRCSPTRPTTRRGRRSGRSPCSARSGRRSGTRRRTTCRCGSATCPAAHQFAADPVQRTGLAADPLARLAAAGGYDDPERWWDDVIEHRRDGGSPFEVIAEAMMRPARGRPGTGRGTGSGPGARAAARGVHAHRAAQGPQGRVRADRRGVRRVARARAARPAADRRPPTRPCSRGCPSGRSPAPGCPGRTSRLAGASGYGAGVHVTGLVPPPVRRDRPRHRPLADRRSPGCCATKDLPVSSAHVIEAVRLADTLATLRGRPLAGLAEVTEATRSVLCGGDDVQLDLVTRRLVVGELLGEVSPDTPQAPLVAADLTAPAKRLRLKRDPLDRELDLDLRTPAGADRSRLLHRLRILEHRLGQPGGGHPARNKGTFRETWALCWEPAFEVDLVAAGTQAPPSLRRRPPWSRAAVGRGRRAGRDHHRGRATACSPISPTRCPTCWPRWTRGRRPTPTSRT